MTTVPEHHHSVHLPSPYAQLALCGAIAAAIAAATRLSGWLSTDHAVYVWFAAWLLIAWLVASITPRDRQHHDEGPRR